MLIDLLIVLYWWLILLGINFLFFPLTLRLFRQFWDWGWIFSKILGIILISYSAFLLGFFHIISFSIPAFVLIIFAFLLINFWWIKRKNYFSRLRTILTKNWFKIFLEEWIFLATLVFWSFIRGFQPNIEGLEKFMDFGFVNSILRSQWFPPQDMWFAGESINYYYFGHLQAAVLTKLSGLDSAVTYNLMMATVFALTFTGGFSLASNLWHLVVKQFRRVPIKQLVLVGLISAFLLTLGGNLHTVVYVLKDGATRYWYPDATRFIGYRPNNPNDKTIHEFPSYSFVVADLHGHMNNIPTVLLFLALLFVFGSSLVKKRKLKIRDWKLEVLLIAGLLAVMYMTNSWDFPIYGVFFALFVLLLIILKKGYPLTFNGLIAVAKEAIPLGMVVLSLSFIFSLPFSLNFSPMAEGIAKVRAQSLWWQLLILWGFFWFIAFGFWLLFFKTLLKSRVKLGVSDIFVFSATLWATILIIIPEFIYVKDIYTPEHHRANTMFKLVYQSFVIYSLVSGYIFLRSKTYLGKKSLWLTIAYCGLFLAGFVCHLSYPFFAIRGYYGEITRKNYKGLFGLEFLKDDYSEYEAILWLKKNLKGQPVVLEAPGDSYTHYNRVSAVTGLPTIQGWLVHEWLWRGGWEYPGDRQEEVRLIFEGENDSLAKYLLKKYQVEYVFVGDLEKKKYPLIREDRFSDWGEIVFSSGETKIYRLKL